MRNLKFSIDDSNTYIKHFLIWPKTNSSRVIVIAGYFLTGLALGVIARFWMRWISTDPEFSWSGTIFIIGAFTIFFTAQSLVSIFSNSATSQIKSRLIRVGGLILTLPLFMGAGATMFPSVALASFGLWSGLLHKRGQLLLLSASLIIPLIISKDIIIDFGWSFATLGRILLFFLIYTVIVLATRPTISPNRNLLNKQRTSLSFRKKALIISGLFAVLVLSWLSTIGLPSG
jgi:hypothetical protein